MGTEENKAIVRKVEWAWAANDLNALDQYFSRDFDNSTTAVPGPLGVMPVPGG